MPRSTTKPLPSFIHPLIHTVEESCSRRKRATPSMAKWCTLSHPLPPIPREIIVTWSLSTECPIKSTVYFVFLLKHPWSYFCASDSPRVLYILLVVLAWKGLHLYPFLYFLVYNAIMKKFSESKCFWVKNIHHCSTLVRVAFPCFPIPLWSLFWSWHIYTLDARSMALIVLELCSFSANMKIWK